MKSHTVKQGECLITIAAENGFGGNWQALYDHEVNADLRKKRPDPFCLMPGDVVNIPDEEKTIKVPTNKMTRLVFKRPKAFISVKLVDADENIYKNVPYELHIAENTIKGNSDVTGLVQQLIPVTAEEAKLLVWPLKNNPDYFISYILKIGNLDPVDEITGQQARLSNQGFACGKIDGIKGPKSEEAIKQMEYGCGLKITGNVENETLSKLTQHEQ